MILEPEPQKNIQGYFYSKQLKSYLGMFMAIFAGLHVETGKRGDGETRFMKVPVVYGSKDRVVAAVLGEHTQNKPIQLPVMSAYMRNLQIAPERMKGSGLERSSVHVPQGGLLPDDVVNLKQRMPVPYNMDVELSVYTSNLDQHWQILEQIMMLFDPSVQIERSDSVYDWAKNVIVTLTDLDFDENYPAGTERRKIQTTLRFQMPIWIESPASYKNDVVKVIKLRIQAMTDLADFAESVAIAVDDDYDVFADAESVREEDV